MNKQLKKIVLGSALLLSFNVSFADGLIECPSVAELSAFSFDFSVPYGLIMQLNV